MYLAVFEQRAASSPAEENNLKTMIDKVCLWVVILDQLKGDGRSCRRSLVPTVASANGLVYNLNPKFLGKALSLLSERWKWNPSTV